MELPGDHLLALDTNKLRDIQYDTGIRGLQIQLKYFFDLGPLSSSVQRVTT